MVLRILGCFGDRVHEPAACTSPRKSVAGQQPPASDRHTDRDSNSEHDNNKPSTSMASSVGTTSTKVNKSSVVRVNGQVHRVRTLQTVIETSILPRYADSEMFLDDTRTLYAERTVRVVEEGFKEAPQLKQD
jgi:hypothetical protein